MNGSIGKTGTAMKPNKLNLVESCDCNTPYFVQNSQTCFKLTSLADEDIGFWKGCH